MTPDLLPARLRNQGLVGSRWRSAGDVVAALGAVQAQDYAGAKWALALRLPGATDAAIDRAFDAGEILRTHVLRPTWHFVAPADLRWLLSISAPRVHRFNTHYYSRAGLDTRAFARSRKVFERALEGGASLTRNELAVRLARAGIAVTGNPLAYVMMHAELEGVICSGPRRGRQFTYALLDERAPSSHALKRDAALAELTRRYFTSHGPATRRDFVWWSGLTVKDVQRGIEMNARTLDSLVREERTYWHAASTPVPRRGAATTFLLPNYDESLIAYKDRTPNPKGSEVRPGQLRLEFAHQVVVNGLVVGSWRRTATPRRAEITVRFFAPPSGPYRRAVAREAARLSAFLGTPVDLRWA